MSEATVLPRGAGERLAAVAMPRRIAALRRDGRGYPVPRFVDRRADKANGEPDFRIMDGKYLRDCIRYRMCWICGGALARLKTFPIGPMCAINRNIAEPPSHLECCQYSAKVCPFLSVPEMRRIEVGKPKDAWVSGEMIARNPGVVCLWTVEKYKTWSPRRGELLFDIGDPVAVEWWARGRIATRAEVDASISSGMQFLEELARQQVGGMAHLATCVDRARQYLPEAA